MEIFGKGPLILSVLPITLLTLESGHMILYNLIVIVFRLTIPPPKYLKMKIIIEESTQGGLPAD